MYQPTRAPLWRGFRFTGPGRQEIRHIGTTIAPAAPRFLAPPPPPRLGLSVLPGAFPGQPSREPSELLEYSGILLTACPHPRQQSIGTSSSIRWRATITPASSSG